MRVISGRSSGVRPPLRASVYMYVDNVSSPMVPLVKNVTAKSSSDMVKARKKPLIIPGLSCGIRTLKSAWEGVAPRSSAASYVLGLSWVSLGSTLNTTYGVQNDICASMTVTYPWLKPRKTKSRNRETPVITSGLSIGMLLRNCIVCFLRPRRLNMPMAAIVPNIVDRLAAMTAMIKVFLTADISEELPFIPPEKRFSYSLSENPVQLPRTLDSVNENTAMNMRGEYSRMSTIQMYDWARNFFISGPPPYSPLPYARREL